MGVPSRQDLLGDLYQVRDFCLAITEQVQIQQGLDSRYQQSMAELASTRDHYRTRSARGLFTSTVAAVIIGLGVLFIFLSFFSGSIFTAFMTLAFGVVVLVADIRRWKFRTPLLVVAVMFALLAVTSLMPMFRRADFLTLVLLWFFAVVSVAGAWFGVRWVLSREARLVDSHNSQVEQHNNTVLHRAQGVANDYQASVDRLGEAQAQIRAFTAGWFPPAYLSVDAVNFFIHAVENFKADSMKEAVQQFDEAGHRRALEEANERIARSHEQALQSQQELVLQARMANVLNTAQLATQVVTASRISSLRQAVIQTGEANRRTMDMAANRIIDGEKKYSL